MPVPGDISSRFAPELTVALNAAREAARIILGFYTAQSAGTYEKDDGSPVTDADIAADRAIRDVIGTAFPDDAFLTEESEDDASRLAAPRVWIVDPVDGTAQFVARTGKFDVLIALVAAGEPILAVAIQPTTGLLHAAVAGEGAWRCENGTWHPFQLSPEAVPPRIVGSTYYLTPGKREALTTIAGELGASAPHIMDVGFQPRAFDDVQRWYDVFVGFPQDPALCAAREWDIAASDLIVNEAGGRFTDAWGRRHRYNKRDTHISGGIVAASSPALHTAVLAALDAHLPAVPPSLDPAGQE